ncbi:MAG TPA: M23 family metallopeptidase [Gemmatimonadales bacterium]|nr:M23 family metallopeptidase [Gemmatimonadales bacterium]
MIPVVVVPLIAQLVLPLALLGWVAFGHHPYRLHWWLTIALAWAWIACIALAGLWLVLPWYLFLVYAALLAVTIVATWRHMLALPRWPRGAPAWLGAALLAVLIAGSGALIVYALLGRLAPDTSVEVSFPLRNGTYLVVSGGGNQLVSAHAVTLGDDPSYRPWRGQSHGVDLVRLGTAGFRARGLLPRAPEAYATFGDPVHAPCSGSIVLAEDGLPDLPIPERDREHLAGNHIILDCNGIWIVMGHLRRGSVRVAAGQDVETGEIIGNVGNSGNSSEPHLHIHAQRPGSPGHPLSGDPLPIRFDARFLVRNQRVVRREPAPGGRQGRI